MYFGDAGPWWRLYLCGPYFIFNYAPMHLYITAMSFNATRSNHRSKNREKPISAMMDRRTDDPDIPYAEPKFDFEQKKRPPAPSTLGYIGMKKTGKRARYEGPFHIVLNLTMGQTTWT